MGRGMAEQGKKGPQAGLRTPEDPEPIICHTGNLWLKKTLPAGMGVVSAGTVAAPQGVPQVWLGGGFSPGYVVGGEGAKRLETKGTQEARYIDSRQKQTREGFGGGEGGVGGERDSAVGMGMGERGGDHTPSRPRNSRRTCACAGLR